MKTYLVGGAVRDALLKQPVKDRDWVVTGATPENLLEQGYQQVGRDFPVFLHPVSHEEYALARTERKTGHGYTGFVTHFAPDVTLEQDLMRRDLTINAIAQDQQGDYIDPFNGRQDLSNRLLRHVSAAFSEDPLRVLRVARFAARLAHLDFRIAPETMQLMCEMTSQRELAHLTPERVWKETELALQTLQPQVYFQVLRRCGALSVLFPEIDRLFDIPTVITNAKETNAGEHTLLALTRASQLSEETAVRFATLCHHIGVDLPSDEATISSIRALCQRLRVPGVLRDLAMIAARFYQQIDTITKSHPAEIIALFDQIDAWRKPQRIEQLALVAEAHAYTSAETTTSPWPQKNYLHQLFTIASAVPVQEIIAAGFTGNAIRDQLNQRRIAALENWQSRETG